MAPTEAPGVDLSVPGTDRADDLAELWVRLADEQRAHGSHLLAAENRARVREAVVRRIVADRLLVATDADGDGPDTDDIVGFVMFDVEVSAYDQDVDRGVVENLHVRPERRGDGVGAALLAAAEARLADTGVDVVYLEVMAQNEDARRFYRRHGFEPHRVEMEKPAGSDTHSREE